jgi:short subunit dehydrogenase-like uncharacterized protein
LLAGRNQTRIAALAAELNCPFRVFELNSAQDVAQQLAGLQAVLHCAGPFSATAAVMREACLQARTSYLDITGEIDVIEDAAACHERARQAHIAILPAVGTDVVPTDCLAAMLAAELPRATQLQLAIHGTGSLSPGTSKTILENLPRGGRARIDGRIQRVPMAWKVMEVPFPTKTRIAMTIPWGDVASAYYSTDIPNIEVYSSFPPHQVRWARRLRWMVPLLKLRPLQRFLQRQIERKTKGPSHESLESTTTEFWGRVSDPNGRHLEGTITGPNGYRLTVLTALKTIERVLERAIQPGFATPSQALGRDFIREIPSTLVRINSPTS